MSELPAPPGLSQRLTLIIEALRQMIAARAGRDRAMAAIVLLAWPYLHRPAARFEALTRRVRAGRAFGGWRTVNGRLSSLQHHEAQ